MTKIHFRPYNSNQTVLFPQRIDEDIAEHDPVRMVDALVESLNLESFRKLYKECGHSLSIVTGGGQARMETFPTPHLVSP